MIDAICPVALTRLFEACDGPSSERLGEGSKVAATRAMIKNRIDWPCQIKRRYSDVNQGCRLGVSRAISLFFEPVESWLLARRRQLHLDKKGYENSLLAAEMAVLRRFLQPPSQGFFLFGPCGTGILIWLAQVFPEALGIDLLAPEMLCSYQARLYTLDADFKGDHQVDRCSASN